MPSTGGEVFLFNPNHFTSLECLMKQCSTDPFSMTSWVSQHVGPNALNYMMWTWVKSCKLLWISSGLGETISVFHQLEMMDCSEHGTQSNQWFAVLIARIFELRWNVKKQFEWLDLIGGCLVQVIGVKHLVTKWTPGDGWWWNRVCDECTP